MSTASTGVFLEEAVHHHAAASKRGILERLFTTWFKGFVYSQIWEDPRVDAEAMDLGPTSKVLTISSGGCNVLNYLVHRPEKIVAIDLNTCHMSLARLKLCAVQKVADHAAFYNLFGFGKHAENVGVYDRCIAPSLDAQSRKFWEQRHYTAGFFGRRINYFQSGFYDQSKLGLFLRFSHAVGRLVGSDPSRLLAATTLDQQKQFFDDVIEPYFRNAFIRWIARQPATVFSLGIPPAQHQIMHEEAGGELINTYRARLYKLACAFPMSDNYFAWQAFGRTYDHANRQGIPPYLKAENFQTIRKMAPRVETHITTLANCLRERPAGSLNRFVLLDSQDWMPPQVIEELWREIARVGEPGSRIIFRTAGELSPIESALPAELHRRFIYDRSTSRRLHDQDRSAIYGMFHVYILQ